MYSRRVPQASEASRGLSEQADICPEPLRPRCKTRAERLGLFAAEQASRGVGVEHGVGGRTFVDGSAGPPARPVGRPSLPGPRLAADDVAAAAAAEHRNLAPAAPIFHMREVERRLAAGTPWRLTLGCVASLLHGYTGDSLRMFAADVAPVAILRRTVLRTKPQVPAHRKHFRLATFYRQRGNDRWHPNNSKLSQTQTRRTCASATSGAVASPR